MDCKWIGMSGTLVFSLMLGGCMGAKEDEMAKVETRI
jgi:hypothetical protein